MPAQITMSMEEFDQIQGFLRQAREEAAQAIKERDAALKADPTGQVPALAETLQRALKIVGFAVGNLNPGTVRGWPYEDLRAVAEALTRLPLDEASKTLALSFGEFAREAEGYEIQRRERDKNHVAVLARPEDFGPKTEDALRAHEVHRERGQNDEAQATVTK